LYQAPRGTSDILPGEQAYWRHIEQKAADICQLYGYECIDTPAFEDTGLFIRSVGKETDIVQKEMYTFKDRGGNSITLRPEGTAPVCRAYLEHGLHNLPQPVKLYYLASIFRYERPQSGRYRQHYQFGYEAIGDSDPALDVEVIDMAWQFFLSLGLRQLSLKVNSIGCKQCRPEYLTSLKDYYADYIQNLCPECKTRLERNPLRLLDCKKPLCQQIADSAPRSIDHLCPQCNTHFNHGGGRYDDLIEELGGKPTPAIGFATGIERIVLNLKKQKVPIPTLPRPEVFIAHIGDEAREEAVKLASTLRKKGIGAIEALGSKSLKAQLRQANTLGVLHAVIIGEQEVKSGTVILRDMTTSQQQTIPLTQLEERLRQPNTPASPRS